IAASRESEGWLIPGAPSVLPPLRQLIGAVGTLDEAGLGTDLQRQGGGPGSFQILTDRLRLSLPNEPATRTVALRRELSAAGAAAGFWRRGAARRAAAEQVRRRRRGPDPGGRGRAAPAGKEERRLPARRKRGARVVRGAGLLRGSDRGHAGGRRADRAEDRGGS